MIQAFKKLTKSIIRFYRYDCPWLYALSFYVVLFVYWCEAMWIQNPSKWASIVSFTALLFYGLHTQRLAKQGRLGQKRDRSFFLSFLTFHLVVWGILLLKIVLL